MLLAFDECVLDVDRRELHRNGALVHVRTKVFDVLDYLIANRDRVLSRDELLTQVWPGLNVSDGNLSATIRSVRLAIGDDGSDPRLIKTLRGKGFRFVAEVTRQDASGRIEISGGTTAAHARDDTLSIAVLPFTNLNNDPTLDYLADGLADDITTALARFKAFTVISQRTSFQFHGPVNDIGQIGTILQVDYILEGRVRCDADVFHATAQLTHAPTTRHLWAENFDGRIDELFALRDGITQKIATNIKPEIDSAEIQQASVPRGGDLRAQEMAWRARALMDRARLEADFTLYDQCIQLAEAAAAQDPRCRQAWWTISVASYNLAFGRQHGNTNAHLVRARVAAEKLRTLDRNDHSAYMALGWISFIERDFERALTNLNHAYELNPNCTMTLMQLAVVLTSLGKAETGYAHVSRAIRLSPRDLWLGFMFGAQAFACFALEKFEEGIESMRRAIEREPQAPANHVILGPVWREAAISTAPARRSARSAASPKVTSCSISRVNSCRSRTQSSPNATPPPYAAPSTPPTVDLVAPGGPVLDCVQTQCAVR